MRNEKSTQSFDQQETELVSDLLDEACCKLLVVSTVVDRERSKSVER